MGLEEAAAAPGEAKGDMRRGGEGKGGDGRFSMPKQSPSMSWLGLSPK